MNIIVFGATGMMGKQLVQQSLYRGFNVKAFGRNVYTTDYLQTEKLELVKGALFDEGEVFHAVKNCDAVLSALGGGFDGTDKTRSLGIKNIIAQMEKAKVKRIIAIGGMGILDTEEDKMVMDTDDFPDKYLAVNGEHLQAYQLLKASSLDWTFVCPSDISNAGPTGSYHVNADHLPEPNNDRINAGDVAMFMINELEKNEFIKHRVGISN
ncbi:MAG: SDR family oxidoreductase [Ferruginibacter sp.]